MNADPLAALLVKEGVLPPARVEEAQERQVLAGGTLDSALLELGYLDEGRLLELLPRAYNARGVKSDELRRIDRGVTGLFPRRLAEKHGVVPLDVNGRRLTVALAGPPDLGLLDEIGFMLSVYVKPAVTTQARVSWALATHYGVPLAPRMEALLQRVGEKPDEVKAAVEAWHARTSHEKKPSPRPATMPPAPANDPAGWSVAHAAPLEAGQPSAPRLAAAGGGSLEAKAALAEQAEEAERDVEAERAAARRRERVLWTVDDAIAELALAEERDAMLDVVLRFAYRRLSTVAVFILTKQGFTGWDVIDPLLERKDMAAFALPADGHHALAQVHRMRSPFLGPLKGDDPLVRLFGRRARAVMLVPILVGDRFVGVLYGDAATRAIPPSSLAELHMVVPRLGKGLGNLILRKKKALRAAAEQELDIPVVVVGQLVDEAEEDIAVAEKAPARTLPTIEIDLDDIDVSSDAPAIEAPTSLSSDPGPQHEAREPVAAATAEAIFTAWADGKDDDEDVRLDDIALRDLDGAVAVASPSARIELGLDEELPSSGEGEPAKDDDELDELEELASSELQSVPDAPPALSIPDGPMPEPGAPDAGVAAGPDADGGASAVAASPGAGARETLLVATHQGWLAHEDPILDELVGQLHRPADKERKAAVAAVLAHGARALPSLARYFPGVLTVHPFGAMERRPEVHELSDCLACLCRLGADEAAPILVGELIHDDRLHRWAAVWALSSLKVPGALPRLAQRVFDPEPAIAALAIEVLDGYRDEESFPKVLAQVRDLIRRGDTFERSRAIAAVGELRDREALSSLVDLLGTRPKEISDEARQALVDITKQDFGGAERRWRAWIADNADVARTRWLIDGLAAKDDDIRRSAQLELNRMTGQFFGYRWDAPRSDREARLAQWHEWWEAQQKEGTKRWP